jgi:FkbM family methyltransferase
MLDEVRRIVRFLHSHPLTRDRRVAGLARFCKWQIESRLRSEIIVPWVGDLKLAARRGMTGATGNIYAGLHEFADMAFILHFLRREDLFVDVGANVGSFTLLASGICKARTIAFEPDPETMALLRRNVDVNGLHDYVVLREAALGAEEGEVEFTIGLDTMNHVVDKGEGRTRRVPIRTLDGAVGVNPPIMIKVDVDGYEASVFQGARGVLNASTLKAVITEGQKPNDVAPLLEAGFSQFEYDPFQRRLGAVTDRGPGSNALFVRDAAFAAARVASSSPFEVLGHTI